MPLGEDSESYQVQVLVGAAIVRSEISAVPSWTYDVAAQAEDAIAGAYSIEVSQISTRFGPGLHRRIDL